MAKIRELLTNLTYNGFSENSRYSLPNWLDSILDCEITELTDFDISRLLRQKVLVNYIVDEAVKRFINNPLIGTYDGEILKQLSYIGAQFWKDNVKLSKYINDFLESLDINKIDWFNEEDKLEFANNAKKLKNTIVDFENSI